MLSTLNFKLLLLLCVFHHAVGLEGRATTFSFALYYADHMVLQRGPNGASVWGHSSKPGDKVDLYVDSQQMGSVTVNIDGIWQGKVHNSGANTAKTITAVSSLGNITLHDVWFGDVWLCSGQSNMAFFVNNLANATEEESDAGNYQTIRLFQVHRQFKTTPIDDFASWNIAKRWQIPSAANVKYFSAVCWLFGKYLSTHVNYPIGLVESDWGGTPVEAWSSPEALQKCNSTQHHNSPIPATQRSDSTLWNGMMTGLTRTTIFGALWYQGESNSGNARDYSCRFPAMIDDWRSKFYQRSLHTTDATFPFGFVQLAPNRNTTATGLFPDVRWAQTASFGHVPNSRLQNVFMAVAIDLPDYTSPRGTIHPRLKHGISDRLVLSALGVAYHKTGFNYEGPYPSSYTLHRTADDNSNVVIEYDNGRVPIEIRNNGGFQICCSLHHKVCHAYAHDRGWLNVPIISHDSSTVTLDTSKCNLKFHSIGGIRYEWSESPCDFKQCAVYGAENDLPGPPFIVSKLLQ